MRKLWGTSTTRHFVARPPTPHVTCVVFVLPSAADGKLHEVEGSCD